MATNTTHAAVLTATGAPLELMDLTIPALQPGQTLDTVLIGGPNLVFASFIDVSGGPLNLLGETLFIGPTPPSTDPARSFTRVSGYRPSRATR